MALFATGDVYVNFSGLADEADALRDSVQGRNVDRLGDVRAAHHPVGTLRDSGTPAVVIQPAAPDAAGRGPGAGAPEPASERMHSRSKPA
jgi:hypothetical protein